MAAFEDAMLDAFLTNQERLFPKPVAQTREEADAFLADCLAQVAGSLKEARAILEEEMDVSGLSDRALLDIEELFALPDGRFLIVWG